MAEVKSAKPEKEKPEEGAETVAQSQTQETPRADELSQPRAGEAPSTATPGIQMPSGRRVAVIAAVVMLLAVGAVVAGIISGQRARRAREAEREQAVVPTPTPAEEEDALTVSYEEMADSDEIADIEADLKATSFEGIDTELSDIDSELSAED